MSERGVRQGQGQTPNESMEADAVCERCGTVNPEDTLLCKSCGNNLRDQRARRLNESRIREKAEISSPPTRWLGHLLTVFGLLLILWTGLNVNTIEEWLTQTQTRTVEEGDGSGLFTGPDSASFDALSEELQAEPASQSDINRALASSSNPETFEGRYVIMAKNTTRPEVVGEAMVRNEREGLAFVALLRNGLEVRGLGKLDKNGLVRASQIAVRQGQDIAVGRGFAQSTESGLGFDVYGVAGVSEGNYEAIAYLIPPEQPAE